MPQNVLKLNKDALLFFKSLCIRGDLKISYFVRDELHQLLHGVRNDDESLEDDFFKKLCTALGFVQIFKPDFFFLAKVIFTLQVLILQNRKLI